MVLFQTGNTLFGQIYFNESKLLVQADVWFLDYFEYAEFDVILHVFCFRLEITALGKFCPSNYNYQFKLKFGTETNSNIQISMMVFSFSIFYRKYTFGSDLIQKNQNCQFKLKFGTQANSHIQNLMKNSMLTFIISDQKYPFQEYSVKKKAIVSSSLDLVHRLL